MRVLGLMSGTSMDGVDACLLETDGVRAGEPLETYFRAFTPDERDILTAAKGRWPDDGGLAAAEAVIMAAHREAVVAFEGIDLVAFHGQTLAHDPAERRTHQLGDGAALARACNVPVAWDFRTADVAAGGQGAPLASFYHHALVRQAGFEETIAVLNLGGVGNVSVVDATGDDPAIAVLAFDTGPGNALIDDFMNVRAGAPADWDGQTAKAGRVHEDVLDAGLNAPFFQTPPPKSLDRDDFAFVVDLVSGLSTEDGAATLTAFTAVSVAAARAHMPQLPEHWYVCGGGRKNPQIMEALRQRLRVPVDPVEQVGWDGDMLEAQAFAYLAARIAQGLPLSAPKTTGVPAPMKGGILSRP